MRQFFRVRQSDSVSEYIEKFDNLVHQILAHDPKFNVVTITNRFIDGLRDDIKAVVLVQRPGNLDAACSIALLQEETIKDIPRRDVRRNEWGNSFRYSGKNAGASSSQAASQSLGNKTAEAISSPFRKGNDSGRPPTDDRVAKLMGYRKSKGMCYKCGMKWSPTHKCAASVPLQVVEELWQMIVGEDVHEEDSCEQEHESGEDLMAISLQAVQGTESAKTVRMVGDICGKEAIILIDSGSSHNFISEALASKWRNWSTLKNPMQVRVANGEILSCTHELLDCPVWVSGYGFKISLKILPLQCYDIILGIDWLEAHSPMEVNWKEKWLAFDHQGTKAVLQGINPRKVHCDLIGHQELAQLAVQDKLWCLMELQTVPLKPPVEVPTAVQPLVDEFADIFLPPTGLPPRRASVHTIPLVPGAQPFRLRPYRYNSAQKDEIERQIQQLLANGWIKESNSPFASLALLVKKKTSD